ncbi:hypothetical protein JZ751_003683 [Albula glossodonta]|uniref:Uncharacterized protein n=1 Tax=Albula glossodonta TaxID=121402 RepID=A0A8T2NDJ3_9TELE|nr:hypothetical protein JZ751_003683 [Albula glossodonta]
MIQRKREEDKQEGVWIVQMARLAVGEEFQWRKVHGLTSKPPPPSLRDICENSLLKPISHLSPFSDTKMPHAQPRPCEMETIVVSICFRSGYLTTHCNAWPRAVTDLYHDDPRTPHHPATPSHCGGMEKRGGAGISSLWCRCGTITYRLRFHSINKPWLHGRIPPYGPPPNPALRRPQQKRRRWVHLQNPQPPVGSQLREGLVSYGCHQPFSHSGML